MVSAAAPSSEVCSACDPSRCASSCGDAADALDIRKLNIRNRTNKLVPNKPSRTRDSCHIRNPFSMEPPELCGPGRGGRISGPIQRTYNWRGLASYVEAGTDCRRTGGKYRNGAAR